MDTITLLQHYWWLIISLLGAILVFLMFVQGGQALLYTIGRTEEERNMLVNSLGRKWEFTFTTLVTFGGAFFASFPLFYSTSFGGAFYVWMAILFCFVLQAVAYEYRRKPANVFGERDLQRLPADQRRAGPAADRHGRGNLLHGGGIHGRPAQPGQPGRCGGDLAVGDAVARAGSRRRVAQRPAGRVGGAAGRDAGLPVLHEQHRRRGDLPAGGTPHAHVRRPVRGLLRDVARGARPADGRAVDAAGRISVEPYKYLHNLVEMPYVTAVLLLGVVSVLWSVWLGWRGNRHAIWFGGAGTVLTVLSLLLLAGWNNTAYYPSLTDMQSSLTIYNSSSSLFTLRTMAWVSLFVPFVAAYIWYAWRAMNRQAITREEIRGDDHQY